MTVPDGCSNAVASEAAPSSARVILNDNIVQRMPLKAVNLGQVASAMGRGPNNVDDGESGGRLEDIGRPEGSQREIEKTSDDQQNLDHRGNQSMDDAQGLQ